MQYFAPAYMRLLYGALQPSTRDESLVFLNTKTNAEQLMRSDPSISFKDQMNICRNAITLGEAGLGLKAGKQLQLATHGALGTAMQNAKDLNEALKIYVEYSGSRASFFTLSKKISANHCEVKLNIDGLDSDLIPFFTEAVLSTIDQCFSYYIGSSSVKKSVHLAYDEPEYSDLYLSALNASVRFNQSYTSVTFPRRYLDYTNPEADPRVFSDSVSRCRMEISRLSAQEPTSSIIERYLRTNPGKLWGVEDVARALNTSKRTLLRRLQSESTSYQKIRDAVLMEQTKLHLQTMSVSAIGTLLGFADDSSFRRSFKRWFGMSPSEYRDTMEQ